MTRQVSNGKCSFCNATFSKAVMTKHLKSWRAKKSYIGDIISEAEVAENKELPSCS
ncbi:MAG: hypothetical protein DDT29_02414 [Dehalococcoidia bacterium]|nr:hypothetical protein [Bacillota bacterium]